MSASLTDTTILIIGGTSGFGRAVAAHAVRMGARVVIVGRDADKAAAVAAEIGAHALAADATDPDQIAAIMASVGEVDHVVSTVGGAMGGGFLDADLDTITSTLDGKLVANLVIARAVAPSLREGGSLTVTAGAGGAPHTASGAVLGNEALASMVRGLAVELAPRARANAVAPAWTETPLWRDVPADQVEATRAHMASQFPLGRTATIEEVAEAYLYLMTATFVTGHTLFVDGGSSLVG